MKNKSGGKQWRTDLLEEKRMSRKEVPEYTKEVKESEPVL